MFRHSVLIFHLARVQRSKSVVQSHYKFLVLIFGNSLTNYILKKIYLTAFGSLQRI